MFDSYIAARKVQEVGGALWPTSWIQMSGTLVEVMVGTVMAGQDETSWSRSELLSHTTDGVNLYWSEELTRDG